MARLLLAAVPALGLALLSAAAASCASGPPISHVEDKARLDVPIAICRKLLATEDVGDAGATRGDAYFSVLLPSFRGFGTTLHPEDVDCVGEHPFAEFQGGGSAIGEQDLTVSTAEDGKQVTWLRLAHPSEGGASGLLALMRPHMSEIDVYAIGRYKGSVAHSKFEISRLGTTPMIIAHDQGCADVKVDVECDSTLNLYLKIGGKLLLQASTPEEKLRFGNLKGLGRVKYSLTTALPVADGKMIRIHEKLLVRDQNEEDVRKAEGDRVFAPGADGKLVPQQDSIWSQVAKNEPEPEPAKPDPGKPEPGKPNAKPEHAPPRPRAPSPSP
jgi:hypothetical protein